MQHVVRCRNMVGEFGDYFLVADAACLKLTTGNEIVTVDS